MLKVVALMGVFAHSAEEAAKPADKPAVTAAKSTKSKKKATKAKKHVSESKYKTRALAETTETSYRFDAAGNPIKKAPKKKSSTKESSSAEAVVDETAENKAHCSDDSSCESKSSEADAL
jgi:hypothetical protein